MKELIRQQAKQLGFDDCGFTTADAPRSGPVLERWLGEGFHGAMGYLQRNAAKRTDPRRVLPGAQSIIVLVSSYGGGEENGTAWPDPAAGVIARYARFRDYHDVLGQRLRKLATFLDELQTPQPRSVWYVDTGPILERDLAQRAGTGFVGKHTNLISRRLGNWIFLSEILTTLALEPDTPEHNRCGSCTRCLTACPTQAIRAPFQLDARRCISYLTIELKDSIPVEFRPAIGNRIYGCDDCLAVCPWNRFAQSGRLMAEHARQDLNTPRLIELLELDEAGFKSKFRGTPILRTKRRGFLRNVCVALGNVGDEQDLPALRKAAHDAEPLIAEHAAWAIDEVTSRFKKVRNSGGG